MPHTKLYRETVKKVGHAPMWKCRTQAAAGMVAKARGFCPHTKLPTVTAKEGEALFTDLAMFALRYGMVGMKPMTEAGAKKQLRTIMKLLIAIAHEYNAAIDRLNEPVSGLHPRVKPSTKKSAVRSRS